ncbi:MAG: glycine dehydrogenase, partial [Candidatus Izimaplasma sp.]|nr:glycine dehydrogenase [Candidatus Izimaplasma bacterium]
MMFKYLPHTEEDIKQMLEVIGVNSLDDLFSEIPSKLLGKEMNIPASHSELEIHKRFTELAAKNKVLIPFVGAGAYDHYTPSVINHIIQRQEFLTAYT